MREKEFEIKRGGGTMVGGGKKSKETKDFARFRYTRRSTYD